MNLKKISLVKTSAILFALSCSPAPEQAGSCVTSTASAGVYEPAKPFTTGFLKVATYEGDTWCNVSVSLIPGAYSNKAQITTAKHCIDPWILKGVSLEIAGEFGFIPAEISSDYIEKLKQFSFAISGRISKLDSIGEIDYSRVFEPSKGQVAMLEEMSKYYNTKTVPEALLVIDKDVAMERREFGKPLCDVGASFSSFPAKACFTIEDMISFEAEIKVDASYSDLLKKAASSASLTSSQQTMYSRLKNQTTMEFELFQLQVWDNLRQCYEDKRNNLVVDSDSLMVCRNVKDSLYTVFSNDSFYRGNTAVSKSIMNQDDLTSLTSTLSRNYVSTVASVHQFVWDFVKDSKQMGIFNNVTTASGKLVPAVVNVENVFTENTSKKGYGFVTSLRTSAFNVSKGDSGSVLVKSGVPIGVLSTYDGGPVSNGLISALPSVTKEPVAVPEVSIPSVSKVEPPVYTGDPGSDGVDSIEVSNSTGTVTENRPASKSFQDTVIDLNSGGRISGCL